MANTRKKCAPTPTFVSRNQLVLEGFESLFDKELNPANRWVVLANLIPWDEICNIYLKAVPKKDTGCPGLNPRIVLGSIIIKHLCDIDETVKLWIKLKNCEAHHENQNLNKNMSRISICSIFWVILVFRIALLLLLRCL
jgi:hypothetical protein